jgi:hypothetical protein
MKRFALLILLPVLLVLGYWSVDRREFAYRLTLEVDTPSGLRRGESVIRTSFSPSFGWPSRGIGWQGEATFVDLGEGKHVVALLAAGPRGDGGTLHMLVSQAFFGLSQHGYLARAAIEVAELPAGTRVALTGETIPTLVTFSDPADPNSAKVVSPQGFGASFGPGYALRSASFEIVPAGIWPLNLLPIPWPEMVLGTPVTQQIEKRLPFLGTERERLRAQRVAAAAPYTPQSRQFLRDF